MRNLVARIEQKYPDFLKQEYNQFVARAEKAVEDVAYSMGVYMTMNPQTGDVIFHERLSEHEFAYYRAQAEYEVQKEGAMMLARLAIQEVIYDTQD